MVQKIASEKIIQRYKVSAEEASQAATVIQNAYRAYKRKQERRFREQEEPALYMPFRSIDWKIAAARTLNIFTNIRGVRLAEYHKAATLIQVLLLIININIIRNKFLKVEKLNQKLGNNGIKYT